MKSPTQRSLALLLALALAAPPAFAQSKAVRDDLPKDAQKSWDDAKLLLGLKQPDYAKALVKFEEAYDLSKKNPRVLFNIAVCERYLGHFSRAAARLKQELADGGTKLSAKERKDAEELQAALDQFVGLVEIVVDEPGVSIVATNSTGEPVNLGTSPLAAPASLDIGKYELRLEKAGFASIHRDMDVKHIVANGVLSASKETFTMDPLKKEATVNISVSGAPGANIKIDGVDVGPAPFHGKVEAGRHTFTAVSPGYVDAMQTSEVAWKQDLNLSLSLALARHEGIGRVEAPPGAAIDIDGKFVGNSTWEGPLPSGPHSVAVHKPGFLPFSGDLNIVDDTTFLRKVSLTEEKSPNWIAWTVGAVVIVGGGAVASYYILRPHDQSPVIGTLDPGVLPAHFRF